MPKIKRESRQFIVINEEKLITEVEERPILYDKALKGYRKPAIRENAWQEVAMNLGSTVEECKKRWRSLRDAFMKQHKLLSRGDPNTKKKWLFYDAMLFLAPYFDVDEGKYTDEYFETVTDETEMVVQTNPTKRASAQNSHIICISPGDDGEYRQNHIEIDDYNEDIDEDGCCVEGTTQYEQVSNDKSSKTDSVYILNGPSNSANVNNDVSMQNTGRQSKIFAQSQQQSQNDPDERFLLSCLPILKRLPNKKNALARLKIQQLLYDIEFDEYDAIGHI